MLLFPARMVRDQGSFLPRSALVQRSARGNIFPRVDSNANLASMSEKSSRTTWIVVGCGLVGLVGICAVGAVGYGVYAYQQEQRERMDQLLTRGPDNDPIIQRQLEPFMGAGVPGGQPRPPGDVNLAPPPPLSVSPTTTTDRRPRSIHASISLNGGDTDQFLGGGCNVEVTVHDHANAVGYWCRALVTCSDDRLYGENRPDGSGNGYFDCVLFDSPLGVAGEDRQTSDDGGDPFFQIDTRASRFVVMDSESGHMRPGAFRIEAVIDTVR